MTDPHKHGTCNLNIGRGNGGPCFEPILHGLSHNELHKTRSAIRTEGSCCVHLCCNLFSTAKFHVIASCAQTNRQPQFSSVHSVVRSPSSNSRSSSSADTGASRLYRSRCGIVRPGLLSGIQKQRRRMVLLVLANATKSLRFSSGNMCIQKTSSQTPSSSNDAIDAI